MKIAVITSSRHGATHEIGQAAADTLAGRGHDVHHLDVANAVDLEAFDAFVIGSAVYLGHWTKPARHLVEVAAEHLRSKPVWLFSSGPLGDPPKPDESPAEVDDLVVLAGAQEHRLFGGALDRADLGLVERATVRAVHAPYGDFRDWAEIRLWAAQIASSLEAVRDADAQAELQRQGK